MERWIRRTIELGAGLLYSTKPNLSVIPYYPQKTVISSKEKKYFHRSYPEKVGVTSGRIAAMLTALEKEKRANIHNLLVIKDGVVICECSHPGYDTGVWHLSHSMTKTLTGIAIGMLYDDGLIKLDDRVCELIRGYQWQDDRFENMTVRDLLIMSSGVKFSEAGSVTESKWTGAFFSSALSFTPGTSFNYNSMNSYMLARIVCKLSGKSLTEFLDERLFSPLGITNYFLEKGPEGIEKGGWGSYMSVESWAKVGFMMLSGGVFEGKRILSEEWIREAVRPQIKTPNNLGHFDYGFQLWSSRCSDDYLFNGMLGQNVWVCPRNNLIVAINSGNNELFQNSPAMAVIEKYLGQDLSDDLSGSCFAGDLVELRHKEEHFFESRHWIRPYECKRGIGYRLGLRHRDNYPPEWEMLLGKYHFRKNNYGIIPLFIRGMQNNLRNSIDGVSFEKEDDRMFFVFIECGVQYRLEIGFYEFKSTVLDYRGEKYMVSVMGEAMENEDREMIFKLELLFPEMPNTRSIKLSFIEDGRLLMRMSEMPNHKIADVFVEDIVKTNPKLSFLIDIIEKRVGGNYAKRKLEQTFAPTLIGARIGSPNYASIMDEEREKQKASEKTVRIINSLIERFVKDDVDDDTEESKGVIADFFDDIKERIRAKLPKSRRAELAETVEKKALPSADGTENISDVRKKKKKK